jgi:molybdenum cofactor guanylyltransferase
MQSSNITGIILAGGKSSRIGRNKSFLKIGGQYLIERVIDCVSQISASIIIVTNQDQLKLFNTSGFKAKILVDQYPGRGPLGGIYTGLANASTMHSVVVGCDMPFLSSALINHLCDTAPNYDVVVPRVSGMTEPLHAIYSKNCRPIIEQLFKQGKFQLLQLLYLANTKYVDEDELNLLDPNHLSFLNINTENDLIKARVLIKSLGQSNIMSLH